MNLPAGRAGAVLAAVVIALAAGGCGDDDGNGDGGAEPSPPAVAPTTATPPQSPTPGATQPEGEPTTVTATLVDFEIELSEMPTSPGTYTFVVEQEGQNPHALEVEGPGVDEGTATLQPGQSEEMTVTLEPGTYELWCPVGNHREMGMELTIDVS